MPSSWIDKMGQYSLIKIMTPSKLIILSPSWCKNGLNLRLLKQVYSEIIRLMIRLYYTGFCGRQATSHRVNRYIWNTGKHILLLKRFQYFPQCFLHFMMTSSKGNIFHVTGHLCGEFTGDRWIPRTKASDAELSCSWINSWINNCEAGDLRRHRAHHDVIVLCQNYLGIQLVTTVDRFYPI